MKEINFDLSDKKPKKVTKEMIYNADKIIIMSHDLEQFYSWDKKPIIWDVNDVVEEKNGNFSYHQFVNIRNKIKKRIENLVKEVDSNF